MNERCSDLAMLHPLARASFEALSARMGELFTTKELPVLFKCFETYRSPLKQAALGPTVTHARPWESPHQYGLAADFVVWDQGKWSWEAHHPWDRLENEAERLGLYIPIKWDRCHIEHPRWQVLRKMMK